MPCTGNSGFDDSWNNIDIDSPRRYALPGRAGENALLVIGASTNTLVPWPQGNTFYSVATAWAPGSGVSCASSSSYTTCAADSGSSISAALTSGMAATYIATRTDLQTQLTSPFSASMWQLVRDASVYAWGGMPPTVPTLSTYNYIPCSLRDDSLTPDANFTSNIIVRSSSGTILNKYLVRQIENGLKKSSTSDQ